MITSEILTQIREKAGINKRIMAQRLKLSESYYCQLENKKEKISLKIEERIKMAFPSYKF